MPERSVAPTRRQRRFLTTVASVLGLVLVVAGLGTSARDQLITPSADAAVTPTSGFTGTVAGWTSWYGAYGLADLGWAWCIDHGSAAPDPELHYAPTSIDLETDPTTQAAMAWAVTMNPPHDPVTAAAIMLALHDLRHAEYPFGTLDLDRLGPADLAGFGGLEAAILDRAKAIKGDALAHGHRRGPFVLDVTADRAAPGRAGALRTTLTDAGGAPVAGVAVAVSTSGATLAGPSSGYTGDDGVAWFAFEAGPTENRFAAHADLPRTEPAVFTPTAAEAQRVIVPAWAPVDGVDAYGPVPTTTTTTTPTTTTAPPTTSTTTTTAPPTTSTTTTTAPPTTSTTTTTAPPTTAPPTTSTTSSTTTTTSTTTTAAPPSVSTTTSAPAPSTRPTGPSPARPSGPSPTPSLPRTGLRSGPWALIGIGLTLCGWALTTRRRPRVGVGPPARTGAGIDDDDGTAANTGSRS